MSPRPSLKEKILDSAESLVNKTGAANLTLDAVAHEAGVSKGGLLYHFPNKDALLEGLVTRLLKTYQENLDTAKAKLPETPGQELMAHLDACLKRNKNQDAIRSAMLAAAANDPAMLEPARQFMRERIQQLGAKGYPQARAVVLALAADGLMFLELFRLLPLNPEERNAVVQEIFKMAREGDPA